MDASLYFTFTPDFYTTHTRDNLLCFRANRKFLSLLIFSYEILKWIAGLAENEILRISYLSSFGFFSMLTIIHVSVSLESWPIAGVRMARLMQNTWYNLLCYSAISKFLSLLTFFIWISEISGRVLNIKLWKWHISAPLISWVC